MECYQKNSCFSNPLLDKRALEKKEEIDDERARVTLERMRKRTQYAGWRKVSRRRGRIIDSSFSRPSRSLFLTLFRARDTKRDEMKIRVVDIFLLLLFQDLKQWKEFATLVPGRKVETIN